MKLIDTHCHLYIPDFDTDRVEVLNRARKSLHSILLPNIDEHSISSLHSLADSEPDFCFPMMGLHPCYVKENFLSVLENMEILFSQRKYYGVGETGLDYYWDLTWKDQQKESLKIQIEWAKKFQLPLILHCRDSMEDVLTMVEAHADSSLRGIFHCFGGTLEQAKRAIDCGFLLGIGGVLTYKKSDLPAVLTQIDLSALVLETDAPYLPPVPNRGKRNEPAWITFVAEKLAECKRVSVQEIATQTTLNACKLFQLPVPKVEFSGTNSVFNL